MSRPMLPRLTLYVSTLEIGQIGGVSAGHLWVLVALVPVVAKALTTPLPLLDFWWHLKIGEIIYTTRAIPRVDLFTFTAAGQTYIYQNWLAELIYYATYLLGGLPLIVLFNSALLGLALLLILDLSVNASKSLRLAGLSGVLAGTLALRFVAVRPTTFSIVLFAAFLWVVDRYRREQAGWLWMLPPLMVLWVNLHGAFILGPALLALVIIGESAQRITQPQQIQISTRAGSVTRHGAGHGPAWSTECGSTEPDLSDHLTWRQIGWLAVITLLVILATVVNPEGIGVYDYVRAVQADASSQELVQEWQVPNIRDAADWPFFLALCAGLLVFAYASRKPRVADLVLYCASAAFAMAAIRNVIWFALVSTPILARHLVSIQKPVFWTRLWQRPNVALKFTEGHGTLNTVLAGLLLMLLVLATPWVRPTLPFLPQPQGLEDARTPTGAVRFIEEQGIQGRIFHPQYYGDYLDWRLGMRRQVFVDGRVHLYGKQIVDDYLIVLNGYEHERLLKQYGIQLLLLDRTDHREARLREAIASSLAWQLVYEDSNSLLFQLKGATPAGRQPDVARG